jgi:hypothetical protein
VSRHHLYDFFVTDDRSRWRAFIISGSAGTVVGVLLFIVGVREQVSALVACISNIIAFMTVMFGYSPSKTRIKQDETLRFRRSLAVFVKLPLVAGATWLLEALSGNVFAAVAYAAKAQDAVKNGNTLPIGHIILARTIIELHLTRATGDLRSQLIVAQAILASAQTYTSIRDRGPDVVGPTTSVASLRRPVWLIGSGAAGTIRSTARPAFRTDRDMIVDSFTVSFDRQFPFTSPNFIEVVGNPLVIVTNCTVQGYSQDLSRVVWFNVVFENCSISASGKNLTLVNVTLKNCEVHCDEAITHWIPQMCKGNASNITFSL